MMQKPERWVVWPKPKTDPPSIDEMEDWVFDTANAEATDGCEVESDGVCEHGYPSWLVYLGYI